METSAQEGAPPVALEDLPASPGLPDLFTFANGEPVNSVDDWRRRREELKDILLYYQYGRMPGRPESVEVVSEERAAHPGGLGAMEFLTLQVNGRSSLRFRAVFYLPLPHHAGRRPVIIREEDRIGQRKDAGMFLEKGYIFVEYARHDLDPDRDRVVGAAQAAFPDHDWATLAVWAWCGMRLVDYLETRTDVDMARIGLTGHSRGGKMALLTAALDERISLVVPHQSGCGGAGCYRVLGPGAETLAQNDKPHWYHERIRWFGDKEERLPFDQHFLKALVAPRALLCTESIDDEFANPLGSLVTTAAAQDVYRFLGFPERNGIHFRRGGHSTETRDWQAILDFAEWQFFGKAPAGKEAFWRSPFPLPEGFRFEAAPTVTAPPLAEASSPTGEGFTSPGSPGNEPDRDHHGRGRFGAVDHAFEIAVHQVTNQEYAAFLNATAAETDPGALYVPAMADAPGAILRSVTDDGFSYVIPRLPEPRPVTHVSWTSAIRYCNWMHNGRPEGKPSPATTEDGAYTITGGVVGPRRAEARYFLPSADEWYKAAYFTPEGNYEHFAPGRDDRPVIDHADPELKSPCGMAGFADKVWEWTESPVGRLHRALRSGAWFLGNNRQSAGHFHANPGIHDYSIGFRVARPADGDAR